MNEEQRIKLLEEELKILKNEVKTILLDIREQYLNIQNPFNFSMVPNTGTPPAGPDEKDRESEVPAEEFDLGKSSQPEAATEFDDTSLNFGKPFADLTSKPDAGKPGMPGLGMPEDNPEPGPSAGPGDAGPSADNEAEIADETEEEPPKKHKGSRKKKAVEMETEMESEELIEEDLEEKIEEDRAVLKGVSPKNGKKKAAGVAVSNRADLVVIAGLTQWVDQSTGKLGKDRTEALVEMSTAMGRIPDNIKDVLIRMVRISRYESNSEQSPMATDYLAVLAQLESLMGGSQQDNALLSVLSMMKESKRG